MVMYSTATAGAAPFGHFSNIMNRPKPGLAGQVKQKVSGMKEKLINKPKSPMLDGLKHTGEGRKRGMFDRGMGRDNRFIGMRDRMEAGQAGGFDPVQEVQPEAEQQAPGGSVADIITGDQEGGGVGAGFTEETAPGWGTTEFQQSAYNLAREQQTGQTAADVEFARSELGGRGFRAGESGIANKAIMALRRTGAERLGQQSRGLAMQGMQARYGQQQDMMNMLMRMYGMQGQQQEAAFDPYREQVLRGTNV